MSLKERVFVYVSILSAFLSVHMVVPVIGLYTSVVLGAGPLTVGLVYGVGTFTSFVLRVPTAWVSRRLGLRNTMAAGLIASTAGSTVFGFATTPEHMVAGSLLRGFGSAFFFPSALSTVYEEAGGGKGDARSLGYMLTAPALGMTLGPVMGAGVLSLMGYQPTFFSAAAISSIGLLSILSARNHVKNNLEGSAASLKDKRFLSLLISRFFINYITGTVSAFLPLMAKIVLKYDEPVILLLFSAGALANLSSRAVMGAVAGKLGAHNYILAGSVTLSASATLFSLGSETLTWASMLLYGFGMGVFVLGSVYLTGLILPLESRTMGFALLTLMIDVGSSVGNFFSGVVLTVAGFAEVFTVAALAGSVGAAVDVFSRRWPLPSERQRRASA
ncbi:MAG: MFS transporter [Candidatus Caldarchaeum sp.]